MNKNDREAILQAAAKVIDWELYGAASYCRTRARLNVEAFNRELRSALRRWSKVHTNLNPKKGSVS